MRGFQLYFTVCGIKRLTFKIGPLTFLPSSGPDAWRRSESPSEQQTAHVPGRVSAHQMGMQQVTFAVYIQEYFSPTSFRSHSFKLPFLRDDKGRKSPSPAKKCSPVRHRTPSPQRFKSPDRQSTRVSYTCKASHQYKSKHIKLRNYTDCGIKRYQVETSDTLFFLLPHPAGPSIKRLSRRFCLQSNW